MVPGYEKRSYALRVTKGARYTSYPMRFHNHIEIVFVRDGFMDVTIDGKPYTLHDGDLYIVFPNLLHSIRQADAGKTLILASPELFSFHTDILSRCKPVRPVLYRDEMPPIAEALCRRMLKLSNSTQSSSYGIMVAHARSLMLELLQLLELEERSSDCDLVQQLVLHLLEHYTEDITLDTVSRTLGYSKFHLSHVIADTFGCNFRSLINSYRITMAQNLILTTDQSISQIAFACGFKNQSSFNRIFLKLCGVKPSDFRHQSDSIPDEPHLLLK